MFQYVKNASVQQPVHLRIIYMETYSSVKI